MGPADEWGLEGGTMRLGRIGLGSRGCAPGGGDDRRVWVSRYFALRRPGNSPILERSCSSR